jgi:hypothetical protein
MLRFVMTATERLTILIVEVRASSTSRDDLVDIERTVASSERGPDLDEASSVAGDHAGDHVGAFADLCSTLLRVRAERGSTDGSRPALQGGTAANHPFLFVVAARS